MMYERRRWTRIVLACVGATLVAACSTVQVGHDFDIDTFAKKVEQGVTTEADVRAWLGAPTNVGEAVNVRGEHHVEWTYYFARGHLPGMKDAKFKTLQVRFDDRGTVLTYSWSGGAKK
jgi:predicted small secreted protein